MVPTGQVVVDGLGAQGTAFPVRVAVDEAFDADILQPEIPKNGIR